MNFSVSTYMVVASFAYCLALYWIYKRAIAQNRPVPIALDTALAVMIGGFVGARLFHVFYEAWDVYRDNPWLIVQFWRGGFVFYGGFAGALVAAWMTLRLKKESFLEWANFFAPVIAVTYAIGRIGCFLNGCCYGDYCQWPWAVEFDHPGLPLGPRHPTQLYAVVWEGALATGLLVLEKQKFKNIFFIWLLLHGVGRLMMEAFRADDRGPVIMGFSISTLISIIIIVTAGYFLARSKAGQSA